MRDDFTNKTKEEIGKRVGYLCSNPECRAHTLGPQLDDGSVNVGVAAHITAASENGPRYDASLTSEQRSSADNAIWLCQTHAKLIDNDVERFDVETLRAWKKEAEECAAENVGKPRSQNSAVNDLQLFKMTVEAYKKQGTPKFFLDAQKLTNEQRADLFDRAIVSKKGRHPKKNPYKKNG